MLAAHGCTARFRARLCGRSLRAWSHTGEYRCYVPRRTNYSLYTSDAFLFHYEHRTVQPRQAANAVACASASASASASCHTQRWLAFFVKPIVPPHVCVHRSPIAPHLFRSFASRTSPKYSTTARERRPVLSQSRQDAEACAAPQERGYQSTQVSTAHSDCCFQGE